MADSITLVSSTPNINFGCIVPIRNCQVVEFLPDNYLVGVPAKYLANFSVSGGAGNLAIGDRVIIRNGSGESVEFVIVGVGLSNGVNEVEIGLTAADTWLAIGAALAQLPYWAMHYQISPTVTVGIGAYWPGSLWDIAVDVISSTTFALSVTTVASGDLKVLKGYQLCLELVSVNEDCPVGIGGDFASYVVAKTCKVPEPTWDLTCPTVSLADLIWRCGFDISSMATCLFDRRVPTDCSKLNMGVVAIEGMVRRLKLRYYSVREDASGFVQDQNYFETGIYSIADVGYESGTNYATWIDGICNRRAILSVQQPFFQYYTCPDHCHVAVVWLGGTAPIAVPTIDVRWYVNNVLWGTTTLSLTGAAGSVGFYEIPFTMQALYNAAVLVSGGTIPAMELVTGFEIRVNGGSAVMPVYWSFGYDHAACCKLCTDYIIFPNEYGGWDTLSVQCDESSFEHIKSNFCRMDSCPADEMSDGLWEARGLSWKLRVWTLPNNVGFDRLGTLNVENKAVERLLKSWTEAGMGWMNVNGKMRKVVMESSGYDRKKLCFRYDLSVVY